MNSIKEIIKVSEFANKNNIKVSKINFKTVKRVMKNKQLPTNRWYNGNSLLGNDWAIYYGIFGPGDTGKSYWAMKHLLTAKYRNPKYVKLFWTRLTEKQCKKLLADNAKGLLDPDLYRKFGKDIRVSSETVYYGHTEVYTTKTGREISKFKREGELLQVKPLSVFFNNKGQALFDNEYKGIIYIVLDEAVRDENGELNRFNIVEAFTNQIENFCRDYKGRIRIIFIGNNCGDSDILAAFNFIPRKPGRYKLKSRKCVIDLIPPSEKYLEDRKQSAAYYLNPNSKRFDTGLTLVDDSLIAKISAVRASKPLYIIAFSKTKDRWYTIYENYIIKKYNGEKKIVYGMMRYLDQLYNVDIVNNILELYNNRRLLFNNCSTYIMFTSELNKLKGGK